MAELLEASDHFFREVESACETLRRESASARGVVSGANCGRLARAWNWSTTMPSTSRSALWSARISATFDSTPLSDSKREPVVRAMAAGALVRTGSTVAVAVSGVAGPDGGTADKPVGTVWLAWAWHEKDGSLRIEARSERFAGGRDDVRRWTVRLALERLLAE